MTEKEYRIKCLNKIMNSIKDKKIAVYGIGVNAKFILDEFPDLNVLALLDENHEGEYYYDKKVISLQQASILGVQVILIAAKAISACLVSDRIREFCIVHNMQLLNIYGQDEMRLQRNVLNQELLYGQCTEEGLRDEIKRHDIICVQILDVLCACGCYVKEKFDPATIIPKKQMIDIINWAISLEKNIYLVSEQQMDKAQEENLIEKIGMNQCVAEDRLRIVYNTEEDILVGKITLANERSKILYIGTNCRYNLIIPQMYGMDIFLLKGAEDIYCQYSTLAKEGMINLNGENRDRIYQFIQHSYIMPFVGEYELNRNEEKIFLPLDLVEEEGDWINYKPQLYEAISYKKVSELESIIFTEHENPCVSIVIPVYNQFSYTYNCLKSIREYTEGVTYEVIIADDCSDDDTMYLASIVKGIKILRNEKNCLFVLNCNNAASHARGKYIVFLNNDTQVQPGWLLALVRLAEEEQNVGLVGSQLLYPDGSIQEAGGIIWENGYACNYGRNCNSGAPEYNYVRDVDYISGASIMIRTDLWNDIGGFDERYIPAYCEDSDLAFEVRKCGKRVVYQPASKVVHFEGKSNGKDVMSGIKASQLSNMIKFREKWQEVLMEEKHTYKAVDIFVRDRKGKRKVILVVCDNQVQDEWTDKDIINYLKTFVESGYIIKFIPKDFSASELLLDKAQQLGIEILHGNYYRKNIAKWIFNNQKDIDMAYVVGTNSKERYSGLLECTSVKICFSEKLGEVFELRK